MGEFHEIVCIGMDDATSGFGSNDLAEICDEFKESTEDHRKDVLLPRPVGGFRVHLLLGVKNTNLDSVLLRRLPTRVAVYLSPFKIPYGSQIIFAGPHKSFTPGNPWLLIGFVGPLCTLTLLQRMISWILLV